VIGMPTTTGDAARLRRYWDRHAPRYDRQMRFFDRHLFGNTRAWVCAQATGDTLEVAVGTGLNLDFYPDGVRLVGVDFSSVMLDQARDRARKLSRPVDLREGDAHALEFADGSFDTVVCTFSLCGIGEDRKAVAEMRRVLRPGGLLLLADHVTGSASPVRAIQWLLELVTIPLGGEHLRRRPLEHVRALGFEVQRRERFKFGVVERLVARKPAAPPSR